MKTTKQLWQEFDRRFGNDPKFKPIIDKARERGDAPERIALTVALELAGPEPKRKTPDRPFAQKKAAIEKAVEEVNAQ